MWDLRPCLRGPTRPPCCEHITRVEDFYVGMFEADVMVAHHSQSRPGGGGQCLQQGRKAWQVLVVREGQLAPPEQFQEQREGIL